MSYMPGISPTPLRFMRTKCCYIIIVYQQLPVNAWDIGTPYHIQPENNILDFVKIRTAVLTFNSRTEMDHNDKHKGINLRPTKTFPINYFILLFFIFLSIYFLKWQDPSPHNKIGSFITTTIYIYNTETKCVDTIKYNPDERIARV